MSERWLGYLRGSRTGTLFLEVQDDGATKLTIGFTGAGDVQLRVIETGAETRELKLEDSNETFGNFVIESETENAVSGSWKFVTGAAGLFELSRHQGQNVPSEVTKDTAVRVWSREIPLGAVTLYRADLQRLIAELRSLVERPATVTVRAVEAGNIIAEDVETYLAREDYVDVIRVFTIAAEEITTSPLKRVAAIRLENDSSNIFVSSVEEIWTTAVALRLDAYVSQFTSKIIGPLRRHGLNINAFILIAILIWMPDRPLLERVIVLLLGIALMAVIVRSHRLIPFNRVYLDPERTKKPFAREVPAMVMASLAALVTTVLSVTPEIFEFVQKIYEYITSTLR